MYAYTYIANRNIKYIYIVLLQEAKGFIVPDIKAPQKRSLRSRKRETAEEDDPLTEQREPIPVTETNTQVV